VIALYQNLVDQANCHLPYWSNIRKFTLMEEELPVGLINPDGTPSRSKIYLRFAQDINAFYQPTMGSTGAIAEETLTELFVPQACPLYAQSLMHS
jgi:long-chain acyl-CoA synthetase